MMLHKLVHLLGGGDFFRRERHKHLLLAEEIN